MIYILLQCQKTNSIMDFYISVYNTMVFASLAITPLIDVQDYIANIKSNSSFHLFPSVTSFFHLLPSCFHLLPSVTKGIRLCSDYACYTPIYIAMTTFHRSVMDGKNNCVTLSECTTSGRDCMRGRCSVSTNSPPIKSFCGSDRNKW